MKAMTENHNDQSPDTARDPLQAEGATPVLKAEGPDASSAGDASTRSLRPLPEDAMVIVPVRNLVLFPGAVVPLTVGRTRSRAAAQLAAKLQRPLGILLQRESATEEPGPDDLHWVGTTANIVRYVTAADGTHHLICQGEERFRVLEFLDGYDFLVARVQRIEEAAQDDKEIEARALSLRQRAIEILQLLPQEVPQEMIAGLQSIESPSRLADLVAALADISVEEKQSLLESCRAAPRY